MKYDAILGYVMSKYLVLSIVKTNKKQESLGQMN